MGNSKIVELQSKLTEIQSNLASVIEAITKQEDKITRLQSEGYKLTQKVTVFEYKEHPKDAGFRWEKKEKRWYTDSIILKNLIDNLKKDKIVFEESDSFTEQYDREVKTLKANLKADCNGRLVWILWY